jgi:ATP-dependent DNA ligase
MISPMLAQRTSFESAMSDITERHRNFAKDLAEDAPGANSLALKFPTFLCEVKLDGERFLAHVNRGVVTMQVCRFVS